MSERTSRESRSFHAETSPRSPYPLPVTDQGPPRILVVEDDEGIGAGLVRALGSAGYSPRWCPSAADALGAAAATVDLVVLDLGLPDLDGLDLCRRLRSEHPTMPILILTARGSETDVVVGLDAGADD